MGSYFDCHISHIEVHGGLQRTTLSMALPWTRPDGTARIQRRRREHVTWSTASCLLEEIADAGGAARAVRRTPSAHSESTTGAVTAVSDDWSGGLRPTEPDPKTGQVSIYSGCGHAT